MSWLEQVKGNPLPWLLEQDADNPGARCFALRHLLDKAEDDAEVREARAALKGSDGAAGNE
ncbi:MAG: hypothetical protein QHJ81_09790 [Anaerolineae bacterium]|nr:hypothetical protein [Anaerolineae bacterium]